MGGGGGGEDLGGEVGGWCEFLGLVCVCVCVWAALMGLFWRLGEGNLICGRMRIWREDFVGEVCCYCVVVEGS